MLNQPMKPMLLHKSSDVPTDERFIHQLKFDGHRAIFHYDEGKVKIFTRHQNECSIQYPEMQGTHLAANNCILDGEMIVFDQEAKPCFESVMERFQTKKSDKIKSLASTMPAHFVVFDILYLNGKSVMHLPLERRLQLLNQILVKSAALSVCPIYDDGAGLFESVKRGGLEGIVSKNRLSTYKPDTRSRNWLKIKNYLFEVVQVAGFSKQQFGWILEKDGKYMGITEFVPPAERQAFMGIAQQLIKNEDKKFVYLDPIVSCKVKFQCYTKKGIMRSPAVMGFVI